MLRTLFVFCAGFGIGAILCGIQYALIRARRFRRNRFIGLALSSTRASDAAWERGHTAAVQWFAYAGTLAAAASFVAGSGLTFARNSDTLIVYVIVAGALGFTAGGMIKFGAEPTARRAAETEP